MTHIYCYHQFCINLNFMEITVIILLAVLILIFVYKEFLVKPDSTDMNNEELKNILKDKIRLESELKNTVQKLFKSEEDLKKESEEKHKVQGENKRLYENNLELTKKNELYLERGKELNQKVAKFESTEDKRQKEFENKVTELQESRKALEDERNRIRKEDEDKLQKQNEERDKVWNEHENESVSFMKTVCQKPELSFDFFENTNLPETFDGGLKPDFLVKFLNQYIIFDAKMSKSSDLQTYISNQVKSTTKKIKESKNSEEIYSTIFFIVPDMEFISMKKVSFYEDGYSFFVIPKAGFEPILESYKKVSNYDLAESFDPKERENIVNLIASFDHHISRQNSINILSSLEGLKVSSKKNILKKDLLDDIEVKKNKIRLENFKPTDLKRLIQNPEEQIQEIKALVMPKKPEISEDELSNTNDTLL